MSQVILLLAAIVRTDILVISLLREVKISTLYILLTFSVLGLAPTRDIPANVKGFYNGVSGRTCGIALTSDFNSHEVENSN